MKNKTVAAWLAFTGGALGLHRFYLNGVRDRIGWALSVPSLLGVYGVIRVQQFGLDDRWSWALIPLLGFTIAGCTLTAIIYGLMPPREWNRRFNPLADEETKAGATNWLTVCAVALSLLVGTITLMSAIAFAAQRYFEYQMQVSAENSR